jgi:hypothetical protein
MAPVVNRKGTKVRISIHRREVAVLRLLIASGEFGTHVPDILVGMLKHVLPHRKDVLHGETSVPVPMVGHYALGYSKGDVHATALDNARQGVVISLFNEGTHPSAVVSVEAFGIGVES